MASNDDEDNHNNDNDRNNDDDIDNSSNEDNNVDDNADAIVRTYLVGALFQWWEGGLVRQDCQQYGIFCYLSKGVRLTNIIGLGRPLNHN